jgi:hypothetical protein
MSNTEAKGQPQPPTPEQYERRVASIAKQFAPPIYACAHCRWPVIDGYCCNTCGSSDPRSPQGAR